MQMRQEQKKSVGELNRVRRAGQEASSRDDHGGNWELALMMMMI